ARPGAHRGRVERGRGGGRGPGRGAAGAGHGRRGQCAHPDVVLRRLRAEADVRAGAAVSGERVRHAGPRRPDDRGRGGRGAADGRDRRGGLARLVGAAAAGRFLLGGTRGRGAGAAGGVLADAGRAGGGAAGGGGGGAAGGGAAGRSRGVRG